MANIRLSEKAEASMQKVIDRFQRGDLSAITKTARLRLPDYVPAAKWSFRNRVIAFAQGDDMDCRGFRQWQAAGRQVKKGSRAVYILSPITKKVKGDTRDEDKFIVLGFKGTPVFPASSTEGDGPLPDYAPEELPPLLDVADRLGVSVEWLPVSPDMLGFYRQSGNEIKLGTHDWSTFFHELGHAAHGQLTQLAFESKVEKEVIAEFVSAVLMDMYGVDKTGNAWRYIKHYAQDPLDAINNALGIIEQVLEIITGEEDTQ